MSLLIATAIFLAAFLVILLRGIKDAKDMPDEYDEMLSRKIDTIMRKEALKRKLKNIESNHKN
jgi:hypothetical protein